MGGDTSNPKIPILMTQQKIAHITKGGRHFKPPYLVTDKPTDMEVDEEAMDYMDEDPTVLMLRKE